MVRAEISDQKHITGHLHSRRDPGSVQERGYWQSIWLRFKRDKLAVAGGVLSLLLMLLAVGAPWLAPHDPLKQYPDGFDDRSMPIAGNSKFLLGTDTLGRDLLSRLIWGARVSITIGVFANAISIG